MTKGESESKMAPRIRWGKEADEIDRLNSIVQEKVKKFVEESASTNKPLSAEVKAVLEGNHTVYRKRFTAFPVMMTIFGVCVILFNFSWVTPLAFVASFVWYDFFSGVLHIVLDNPDFINLPLLGQPCLEFQWHHHIPNDLSSKSFLEVCGDLNVVILILSTIYLAPMIGFEYRSPIALTLVGCKLIMSYFGQLCHCMSHTPVHKRPQWVIYLQDAGLMISPKEHGLHHQSYDGSFCIGSGLCNPALTWLLDNFTSNKWFWLAFFFVSIVADVPILNFLFTTVAGVQ